MYTAESIASIVRGALQGEGGMVVNYLSTDSRKISFAAETCFFALNTPNRNGHQFITEVYDRGVRCFVISDAVRKAEFPGAAFITVTNTLEALQALAAEHRQQFSIPVIGITGSNGKTIVKEWLNQLLQEKNKVVRSPKSYNSQVGVPLSVWQMKPEHTVGIFEAGISRPGEMDRLEKIIRPTIGILTNIGAAHDEGFASREAKLREKLLLFREADVLVCNGDDELISAGIAGLSIKKFTWGYAEINDLRLAGIEKENGSTIHCTFRETNLVFQIPFTDDASLENALHCIALLLQAGIRANDIQARLGLLHPVQMRLEWKKAINNSYLLNDSYSNDLSSLIIALDYLQQQQQGNRVTVILSDFFESGIPDETLYATVARLLQEHKVRRLYCIGTHISKYQEMFRAQGMEVKAFETTTAFTDFFESSLFASENILLKGARRFEFERIAKLLELHVHQTILEINLTAISHNLHQYRQQLKPGVKLMAMVKAFGYGSGDVEVARVLQFNKVDYLAVAYADEGAALRKAGISLPIMVMNPEYSAFELIEAFNLEPEIYSFQLLDAFTAYCWSQGIAQFPVHIKLDTGMHRLGFEPKDIDALAEKLVQQNLLVVRSVFTHFAASEDGALDDFTRMQGERLAEGAARLQASLGYSFIRHAGNTAAINRHKSFHFDMVRLGIGLYGIDSNAENLRIVSSLKTTVAQVKKLEAGETVGYGRKGRIDHPQSIATVNIGYADGYRRVLGNGKGKMLVGGSLCPVIGNVSMDMTMIDVTAAGDVQPGDSVEIFGEHVSVNDVASQCDTIPYEILTGISQRVKRIYIEE